jgi:leucine dehydrogenase
MLGGVRGKRVAIQGAGSVGHELARLLAEGGAHLVVADVDAARVERVRAMGAEVAPTETIHTVEADVFAPCALGGVFDERSIPELGAPIVCGAANNQLARPEHGALLLARGVIYAPDYLVNAGGIICAAAQYLGEDRAAVDGRVRRIPDRLRQVLDEARGANEPPHLVADRMARARVEAAAKHKQTS